MWVETHWCRSFVCLQCQFKPAGGRTEPAMARGAQLRGNFSDNAPSELPHDPVN